VTLYPSLTAGLHQLMATFYKVDKNKNRNKILMLSSEFNSDVLAIQSWTLLNNIDMKENIILIENSIDP
jgi:hypothetical protein